MIHNLRFQTEARARRPVAWPGRGAFTLLELLMVLGVIVAVVAMSWPNMIGLLRHHNLAKNAEQVRLIMDEARVVAIEEGRTMQVRFEISGPRYVFLPETPFDGAITPSSDPSKVQGLRRNPFHVYKLTEKCNFLVNPNDPAMANIQAEQLTEQWVNWLDNPLEAGGAAWTTPVRFFPDGTATDSKMIVVDGEQQAVEIWVRGLTGSVVQSKLTSVQEMTNGAR